jgi:hypothetical protein
MTHTPGPWETKRALGGGDIAIVAPGKLIVAEAYEDIRHADERSSEVKANASLIAAAPDLLSIAKRWTALDAGSWHVVRLAGERGELLNDTRTAIAKAEEPS